VNEILLQSHQGVLRFFPVWAREQHARFGNLRAVGAFLVSAELRNGVVGRVKIQSEKGRVCTVQNPWPGQKGQLIREGQVPEPVSGERFTLETAVGETIELQRGAP
jgi:alpha-L-fucosidase 2